MGSKRLHIIALCLSTLLMVSGNMPLYAQPSLDELVRLTHTSSIVFVGTVRQMRATTVSLVQASPRTAIVQVDRIFEKPQALTLWNGRDITIEVTDTTGFRAGIQALFYTDWGVIGSGIAVQENGHERFNQPLSSVGMDSLQQRQLRLRELAENLNIKEVADVADLVVAGAVTVIRPPVGPSTKPQYITEHAPIWLEAIMNLTSVLKGTYSGQQIVIRFPSSQDVAYYTVPKYAVGDQRVVLLKRDTLTGYPQPMSGNSPLNAYTSMHPLSVLPAAYEQRVRAIIRQQ